MDSADLPVSLPNPIYRISSKSKAPFLLILECVLYLIPKALALDLILVGRRFLELTQQLFLLVGQVLRHLDVYADVLVAATAAVDILDALAAHAERSAGLCAFRNLVLDAAVDGRHLQRIAECGLCERNRNIDMYIRAVAGKDRMRTDGNRYEQIACGAAVYAGIALTALLDGLTIVDTGRNVDLELAGLADTTLTAALRTRLLDDLAGAAAVRAGALRLDRKSVV